MLQGSKVARGFSASGGRGVFLGPDPAGLHRVALVNINPRTKGDLALLFREALKLGDGALKQYVAQRYADIGWKTSEVLQGMMESTDLWASEVVRLRPLPLYKGRFVLVGDAGYATGFIGTGTSLAIAVAYLLAGDVCKHKGDVAAGLEGHGRG